MVKLFIISFFITEGFDKCKFETCLTSMFNKHGISITGIRMWNDNGLIIQHDCIEYEFATNYDFGEGMFCKCKHYDIIHNKMQYVIDELNEKYGYTILINRVNLQHDD